MWKLRLQSCRLSNLEERVLGVRRENDLPGSEAPERFFRYLQTGDFSLLEEVIAHNLQDVVTLAVLLVKLAQLFDEPLTAQRQPRPLQPRPGAGKAGRRAGGGGLRPLPRRAGGQLSASIRIYRRAGEWERARAVLEAMVRKNQMGYMPHIELAKLYEHHDKQLPPGAVLHEDRPGDVRRAGARRPSVHRRGRLERKLSGGGNKTVSIFGGNPAVKAGNHAYRCHVDGNKLLEAGKTRRSAAPSTTRRSNTTPRPTKPASTAWAC